MRLGILENFILKRVFIFLLFMSIINLMINGNNIFSFIGLIIGVAMSILRLFFWGKSIDNILTNGNNNILLIKSILRYVILFLLSLLIFFIAYYFGLKVFIPFAIGSLAINIVTFLNSITEALGITKNNFEDRGDWVGKLKRRNK